jgi:hypothetical protein
VVEVKQVMEYTAGGVTRRIHWGVSRSAHGGDVSENRGQMKKGRQVTEGEEIRSEKFSMEHEARCIHNAGWQPLGYLGSAAIWRKIDPEKRRFPS